MDWLYLLAVQGTLRSLLQHHNLEASVLRLLVLFMGQLLVAQRIKCLPAMRETRVWSLGWEDPLEKEMETHSSILAWRIPWTEEPGGLQSTGSQRVGHDWVTSLHTYNYSIRFCKAFLFLAQNDFSGLPCWVPTPDLEFLFFSKKPWFLLVGNDIGSKICALGVLITTSIWLI